MSESDLLRECPATEVAQDMEEDGNEWGGELMFGCCVCDFGKEDENESQNNRVPTRTHLSCPVFMMTPPIPIPNSASPLRTHRISPLVLENMWYYLAYVETYATIQLPAVVQRGENDSVYCTQTRRVKTSGREIKQTIIETRDSIGVKSTVFHRVSRCRTP